MWILLGLLGLMMAGGVADAFIRVEPDGNEDGDEEPEAIDRPGGDSDGSRGDMFDYLEPDAPSSADMERGNTDAVRTGTRDSAVDDTPPGNDDWDGIWVDDEFISTDEPEPVPGSQLLRLGDDGGTLTGGDGDDTLVGGAGDDTLRAGGGNTLLHGGGGDDALYGGAGDDTLFGGAGDDVLRGGGGRNLLSGGDGNDHLTGGEDDDTLFGGAGDDTLLGGWGDDLLVAGSGSNLLNGGAGNDTLIGVRLDENGADTGGVNFLNGGDGDDLIVLGSGDIASGGNGADTFVLGDWLDGSAPAVIMDFNPGEDHLIIAYDGTLRADPDITVEHDSETGASRVLLDGEVIAVLQGIEDLSPDMIELQPIHPDTPAAPSEPDV